MGNKFLKILGVLAFLAIPQKVTETYLVPQRMPEYKTEIKLSKEEKTQYRKTINEIEEEILLLNKEREFFSERLNPVKIGITQLFIVVVLECLEKKQWKI